MTHTQKLLELTNEFAVFGGPRQWVDYNVIEDQQFITKILSAVKNAAPEIRNLLDTSAANGPPRALLDAGEAGYPGKRVAPPTDTQSAPEANLDAKTYEADIQAALTTLSPGLVGALSPSTDASPAPETAQNTRNPVQIPCTDGTGAALDRKSDTSDTAEAAAATETGPAPSKSPAPAPKHRGPAAKRAAKRHAAPVPRALPPTTGQIEQV